MATESRPQRRLRERKEAAIKADFRKFLYLVWKHLKLPDPTPLQYDIAKRLQHGPKRDIVEAFRGIGKSWITTAFVCWNLYRDPQMKIMVVSASKSRADASAIFIKRLIAEMPILQHLQARKGQRDSNIIFDVGPATPDDSPSVKSVGVTGQLTGSRANLIVGDDIEIPKNSATVDQRDKLSELVKEFDAILKPYDPDTMSEEPRVLYLGTPQTEESLYNKLTDRGYGLRIWPALMPNAAQRTAYGAFLAPLIASMLDEGGSKAGEPTDPQRFSAADLGQRQISYGKAGFSLQFMLDTSLSDALKYPLKLSDLIVMNLDASVAPTELVWSASADNQLPLPQMGFTGDRWYSPASVGKAWTPYTGTVLCIDPSGRGKDETSYAIVSAHNSRLYVHKVGGFAGGYEKATLEGLAALALKYKVTHVRAESNFGDGMFMKLFSPVLLKAHRCGTDEVRHNTQKEKRIIDTLEPVMMAHKLVVDYKAVEYDVSSATEPHYSCWHQLTRITTEKGALAHDDRLEALAMAVAYWTEMMGLDSDKEAKKADEKALADAIKKLQKHTFMRGLKKR